MAEDGLFDSDRADEWQAYVDESDSPDPTDRRRVDPFVVFGVALGVVIVLGMILLRPTGASQEQADDLAAIGVPTDFHHATVQRVSEAPCSGIETQTCTVVRFELTDGPEDGFVFTQEFLPGATTPVFSEGDRVVLSRVAPTATVTAVATAPCSFDPETECVAISLLVDDDGNEQPAVFEAYRGEDAASVAVGDAVLVDYVYDQDELQVLSVRLVDPQSIYQFADFDRRLVLAAVAIVFALVVVVLGGWRGATALVGLVVSVLILLAFVLPAILDGRSPVLVAVVGSAAIAFVTMYLAHGFGRMTTIALAGMTAALVLTAVLSAIVVDLARFTGFVTEETSLLTFFEGIDVTGLLLAGIVLGAAGALDDVTITQAATVWELKATDPSLGSAGLFRRALRVGRDHIASIVNTLLLAYAGASLPLLVLFVLARQSLGTIANSEVVAVEIVRTLVGSIGLVAAVPLTTWLAARFAPSDVESAT
ncbi:MAG: YibE/F family protein [Acidimicrobiia bacterium]